MVRRALRRRRSADRAGDLQHLLRHGRAARHAATASRSIRAAPTRPRSRPSRSPRTRPRRPRRSPSTPPASQRPRRHDRQVRVGPRRQRHLRDQQRHEPDRHPHLHGRGRGHLRRAPAGHRQRRRHRPRRPDPHGARQPAADRGVHRQAQPGASAGQTGDLQRLRLEPTPTARSPSTSGTSTATGPTRPTPASTPTTTQAYTTAGTVNVGLRVTDNGGKTRDDDGRRCTVKPQRRRAATATRCSTPPASSTTGAWARRAAPTFADSEGTNPATASARRHLRRARRRRRRPEHGGALRRLDRLRLGQPVNLSGTSKVTVEFWLKWNVRQRRPAGDGVHAQLPRQRRRLPHRPQRARSSGGKFAVGIGTRRVAQHRLLRPAQRRRVAPLRVRARHQRRRRRPQITPYVDGQPVPYTKLDSGTGAGNFANSTLYMMSRAGHAAVRRTATSTRWRSTTAR